MAKIIHRKAICDGVRTVTMDRYGGELVYSHRTRLPTCDLGGHTAAVGAALVSGRAGAAHGPVHHATLGVGAARPALLTRVDALLITADEPVTRTLGVTAGAAREGQVSPLGVAGFSGDFQSMLVGGRLRWWWRDVYVTYRLKRWVFR